MSCGEFENRLQEGIIKLHVHCVAQFYSDGNVESSYELVSLGNSLVAFS